MENNNLERLLLIAEGLGELIHKVVFVGGSVAELYADDPAATDIRPTMDVDCVIDIDSYNELQSFERSLRLQHFVNDTESGVICRWRYKGEIVDIMPSDKNILGFTNQWYKPGIQQKIQYVINTNVSLNILPVLYYIATKIEAIKGRAGEDLRVSHDFEDLVYILNNRQDILVLFDNDKDIDLKKYISIWSQAMINRPNCREEIECMLPYGEYDRTDHIFKILHHFAQLIC